MLGALRYLVSCMHCPWLGTQRIFAAKRSLLAVALLLPLSASAEIRLPNAISDHAVLQRERPIHLWGWATAGARLTAQFHAQTVAAMADSFGRWSLWLAPEAAGGPYTLRLSGDGPEKTISDLLVGDVWFASGQSNMEMPLEGFPGSAVLKNGPEEIAHATQLKLRLLHTLQKSSPVPLTDNPAVWTACTPETARSFSAVAYFFGREIAAKEDVPIGLVDSTWGGTPADAWTSMDTLGANPALLPAFASRARFVNDQQDIEVIRSTEQRQDAEAKAAGRPGPKHSWHPEESSWSPAALYNGMIAPYTPMAVKGFLWYQGEANSAHDRAPFYQSLLTGLIGDWRMHFGQGNLPFFYVQISSFSSPGEDWGQVRDAQRRTLDVANTAMAVTLDVGQANNVHPPDKQTVGARLALAARAMVYGERVEYASPLFRQATPELQPDGTGALRVWFDHGAGLSYRGQPATGFEVAGADGKFVAAEAKVDGETVVVSSAALPNPRYVRYGWMGVVQNNLYNAAGLPASTFSSVPEPLH